jgi:hypothetical protein
MHAETIDFLEGIDCRERVMTAAEEAFLFKLLDIPEPDPAPQYRPGERVFKLTAQPPKEWRLT